MSSLPSLSLPYHTISCIVGDGGGGVVDTGVARLDVGTFCLVVRALGDVIGQHGYVLEGVSEGEGKRRERKRHVRMCRRERGKREGEGGRRERRREGKGEREGRREGKEGGEGGRGRREGKEGGEGGRGRREGMEGGQGGRGRRVVVGWSYQLKQHGLYVPPMEWGASKDSSRVPLGTRSHASFPPHSDV